MAKIFISYGKPDKVFSEKLRRKLDEAGIETWFFEYDADLGNIIFEELRININECSKLILICSQNSLVRPAVVSEIKLALAREFREGKEILLPINLDNYVYNNFNNINPVIGEAIRDRVVADFRPKTSGGKFTYKQNIERLINKLRPTDRNVPLKYSEGIIIHDILGRSATRWITRQEIIVLEGQEKIRFGEVHGEGRFVSARSSQGKADFVKDGGKTYVDVVLDRIFKKGDIRTVSIEFDVEDGYFCEIGDGSKIHNDFRMTNMVSNKWRILEMRVKLPLERVANQIKCHRFNAEREYQLEFKRYNFDNTEFGLEIKWPIVAHRYDIWWSNIYMPYKPAA